jgi:hypothetical protein
VKIKVEFYYQEWRCGDGCCSDSWYNMDIYEDGEFVKTVEEIRSVWDEEDAKEFVKDYFDSEDVEIDF